jgi:hypothetical protein
LVCAAGLRSSAGFRLSLARSPARGDCLIDCLCLFRGATSAISALFSFIFVLDATMERTLGSGMKRTSYLSVDLLLLTAFLATILPVLFYLRETVGDKWGAFCLFAMSCLLAPVCLCLGLGFDVPLSLSYPRMCWPGSPFH